MVTQLIPTSCTYHCKLAWGPNNPFSLKSDQHPNSPCDIIALQNRLVTRIKDMITQDECDWYSNYFYWTKNKNLILILRFKGLKCNPSEDMPCTLLVVREIIGSEQCTVFIDIGAGKLWSTRNKLRRTLSVSFMWDYRNFFKCVQHVAIDYFYFRISHWICLTYSRSR